MALNNPLPPISGFSQGFFKSAGADPAGQTSLIISRIITVLTFFSGFAFLFWFVIGALTWINSVGNPQQVEKAKQQMGSALVGLILTILSYGIVAVLGNIVGLDIINFDDLVNRIKP